MKDARYGAKINLLGLSYWCFITIEKVKQKVSLCLIKHHAMNMFVGWEPHAFFILAPDGGKWSSLCPSHYAPGEKTHSAHWTEGRERMKIMAFKVAEPIRNEHMG